MTIEVSGMGKFRKGLLKLRKKDGPVGYRKALIKALLMVEAESIRRAPIDTGNLRRSGGGNATVTSSTEKEAKGVTFFTANYATPVHERVDIPHTTGEAKFLEKAIMALIPEMEPMLAKGLKASIFGAKRKP